MADLYTVLVGENWQDEFAETVSEPVAIDSSAPQSLDGLQEARFWGTTAGDGDTKRKHFANMETDDLILFHDGETVFATGYPERKFGPGDEGREIGDWLWENPDSELVFTLKNYDENIRTDLGLVWAALGFEPGYSQMYSYKKASDSARKHLLTYFDSIDEFHQALKDNSLENIIEVDADGETSSSADPKQTLTDWTEDNDANYQFPGLLAKLVKEYPAPSEMGDTDQERSTANFPQIKDLVDQIESRLNDSQSVDDRDRFVADSGYGTGTLAHIPYFTIFRSDKTDSSLYGLYVVYLIDPVTDTVYLTLNQGASEAGNVASKSGTTLAKKEVLAAHAEFYRGQIDISGNWRTSSAELSTELGQSAEYNAGTICHISYELADLENTGQILDDLETACELYDTLLDTLYDWPAEITQTKKVWKISPEGGEYWDIWRSEGVGSIHWKSTEAPDADSVSDVTEVGHPRSGERQVYIFENEISEGDIIIAGSLSNNANKIFGIGVVESDYASTDQEEAVPEKKLQNKTKVHQRFIGVNWYPVAEEYLPITVAKDDGNVFHQPTVEEFSHEEFRRLLGAVARRRAIIELEETPIAALEDIAQVLYDENPIKVEDSGPDDPPETTYGDWWNKHTNVLEAASAMDSPEHLIFPEQADEEILDRVESALTNGKHIILTGPPGTGKTKLARYVARHYVSDTHEMVTATADWSTFDTIGGFRPKSDRQLKFHSGVFLERFHGDKSGTPQTEWLIIDELNRADIDKAFGSLLSALTGETIQLPFEMGEESITLIGDPDPNDPRKIASHRYFVPADWRLIGTMNTYDKTSLYQLSYAFMRRFAFIPVSVPDDDAIEASLIQEYADAWFGEPVDESTATHTAELWTEINDIRSIGPAIVRDILSDVRTNPTDDFTDPVIMYVMPQLEGLSKSEQRNFVSKMESFNEDVDEGSEVDIGAIADFMSEYFGIKMSDSST